MPHTNGFNRTVQVQQKREVHERDDHARTPFQCPLRRLQFFLVARFLCHRPACLSSRRRRRIANAL